MHRFAVLIVLPYCLFCQNPPRVQPGTKASPGSDTKVETVEADPNGIVTESKLVAGAYSPPTTEDRVAWWARRAFSVDNFAIGGVKTAFRTWSWWNGPKEWGRGLDGYARRYANREFEVVTGNGIEAGIGALWGEDPRYFHSQDPRFGARIRHAITSSFLTYRTDGTRDLAYARFAGLLGANILSNRWHPNEDRHWTQPTVVSLGSGIVGRMGGNLFREFKPDLMRRVLKKKK
jgi:hypothetical protein